MELARAGISQNRLAGAVGIPRDALSRAMNGKRGFSSLEVAAIAEHLDLSLHWLVTGRPDPNAMTSAARCSYDSGRGAYSNPGQADDRQVLEDIRLAYAQVWPTGAPASDDVPQDPAVVRDRLGAGAVRVLSERIEAAFRTDVVRTSGMSTDYALRIGERRVIVVASTDRWFRENWSLAHELGHMAYGHTHDVDDDRAATEPAANAFAAELLLPEAELRRVDWTSIEEAAVAESLWEWGVSTEALRTRLRSLRIERSEQVDRWLTASTITFLRRWATPAGRWRDLVDRQRGATTRRFPSELILRHETAVADGRVAPATLAWMLGVAQHALSASAPRADQQVDVAGLAAELGLSRA